MSDDSAFGAMIRHLLGRDARAADTPHAAPSPADAMPYEEALQRLHAMASAPTVQARFPCVVHGREAGVVKLFRHYDRDSEVVVESFLYQGHAWHLLREPEDAADPGYSVAEALGGALARGNAVEVAILNVEWVPFLCRTCGEVYCGDCWTVPGLDDPHWPEDPGPLMGACPRGHEQIMAGWSLQR